jgi:hypothetical protein
MKTILVGYEGSKKILAASSYLFNKYMPGEFEFFFLNYGDYTGQLVTGSYIALDDEQKGGPDSWSKYLVDYLSRVSDDFIIFGLDDYLLSNFIDLDAYHDLLDYMKDDYSIGAAKLGISPSYRMNDYSLIDDHVYVLKKEANYSATTQLCIWRRQFLIDVLSKVGNPWQFELLGSDYIKSTGARIVGSLKMPLRYPEPSSISSRHPGKISVFGNRVGDIEHCIKEKYLNERDLIMGQWIGATKTYSECKINPHYSLESCPDTEVEYYKMLLDTCLL